MNSQAASTANSADTNDSTQSESASEDATPQELSKLPRITGIRHWSSADASTVVIDLEDQVQYEAHHLPSRPHLL